MFLREQSVSKFPLPKEAVFRASAAKKKSTNTWLLKKWDFKSRPRAAKEQNESNWTISAGVSLSSEANVRTAKTICPKLYYSSSKSMLLLIFSSRKTVSNYVEQFLLDFGYI